MTYQEPLRHDGDDTEGLPFCSDACPACIAEEAAAQKHLDALLTPEYYPYDGFATEAARDECFRLEQLGERLAEEAAAMASQGFYWGGGEREDYFHHHPAF